MLVIQYNCGQRYKNTIALLETALSVGAGIVRLQESFIWRKSIVYAIFSFYGIRRLRTKARVLMAMKEEFIGKIIV